MTKDICAAIMDEIVARRFFDGDTGGFAMVEDGLDCSPMERVRLCAIQLKDGSVFGGSYISKDTDENPYAGAFEDAVSKAIAAKIKGAALHLRVETIDDR